MLAVAFATVADASAATEAAEWHHHHRHHRQHLRESWPEEHERPVRHRASLAGVTTESSTEVREALGEVAELIREDDQAVGDIAQKSKPVDPLAPLKAGLFPKAHPVVARAMSNMKGDLEDLKEKQFVTKNGRDAYQTTQAVTMARMVEGRNMKYEMQQKETKMKTLSRRLTTLEAESARVREEHDRIVVRLHSVMEPRISSMERRLRKKEDLLSKAEDRLRGWSNLKNKYKASALARLQDRDARLQQWEQSRQALEKAKADELTAHKAYEAMREDAGHEIEAFKYASTKADSAESQEQEAKDNRMHEEESVAKMRNVLKIEESRIDTSLVVGEERIQRRVARARAEEAKAESNLKDEKANFAAWQSQERQREMEASKVKAGFEKAAQAFADKRGEVLSKASDSAVHRETASSDYSESDDWAWDGENSDIDNLSIGAQ